MSEITVTIERIEGIEPHPNADKLEIAKVAGTQTIILKDQFKVGDLVVYFPPDILIPGEVSEKLGVQKYLKTALYSGLRVPCRVAATRLRGVPSYGFAQPLSTLGTVNLSKIHPGMDVTELFRGLKYEPPVRVGRSYGGGTGEVWGGLASSPIKFHEYTDIQHYRKYRYLLLPGQMVRVTEKVHGTNSRVGLLKVDNEWQFYAGSHHTARKKIDPEGRESVYWHPLALEGVLQLLTDLCDDANGDPTNDVIFFGELYGPGVQDLDYGIPAGDIGWRLFDISVNGRYLNWGLVRFYCSQYGVETVPLLYEGPFAPELVDELTYGPTNVTATENIKSQFKGREGIVITPLEETACCIGRLILKSVSADYLDRKGAEDNGDV
ncbi:MAG: RNA ligase family protein [Thermoguttaceae bacterium]